MKVPFYLPDITEAEVKRVSEVLRSGWITTGPVTKQFEKDISSYCGVTRTACVNSATAAMELSLRILGVGAGDEVITSAYTYSASASVIRHTGARVVLADSSDGGVSIDPKEIAKKITGRTKAVIPVDIAGIPADYSEIFAVLEEKKNIFSADSDIQQQIGRIAVISDSAHAFGAEYKGKNIAQWADLACFSFHATKNLTTAEGGCVCFDDIGDISADEIYLRFMLFSLHGQDKDALAKTAGGGWEYDILLPAYKCNMPDVLAAIGASQLERYEAMLRKRRSIFTIYDEYFMSTSVKPLRQITEDYTGSYHLYVAELTGARREKRDSIISEMQKRGVSLNVHFIPLPLFTAYRDLGFKVEDYPNAVSFFNSTVSLPLFDSMTGEQVEYVARLLLELLGEL